jgi:antirestriction protein ArdC
MKDRLDIHQNITDKIEAAIEAGAGDARLPWHRTGSASIIPKNAITGNGYNGINVLSLWATAEAKS